MRVEYVTSLYDYTAWANARILERAGQISDEQFLAVGGRDYGSIRDILVHMVFAQWLWLRRSQGESPRAHWDPAEFPSVAALRDRWAEVARATAAFIAGLDDDRLAQEIHYTTTGGVVRTQPLWEMLVHVANHGTQHRSEVAYLLTQAGHSPSDLDQAGAARPDALLARGRHGGPPGGGHNLGGARAGRLAVHLGVGREPVRTSPSGTPERRPSRK